MYGQIKKARLGERVATTAECDAAEEQKEYSNLNYKAVDNGFIIESSGWSPERGYYAQTFVAKDRTEIGVIIQQLA